MATSIAPELKARIDQVYATLEMSTHYELLGVPPSADKKALKARYFELVAIFHPDKYYGKDLGRYAQKLATVFQRVGEAYEVLGNRKSRREYDEYIGLAEVTVRYETRPPDSMLRDYLATMGGGEADRAAVTSDTRTSDRGAGDDANRAGEQAAGSHRVRDGLLPPQRTSAPTQEGDSSPGREQGPPHPSDPEARRRALGRRLGGIRSRRTEDSAPEVSTDEDRSAARSRVKEDLSRLYAARRATTLDPKAAAHAARADELIESDPVEALRAIDLALAYAPDDPTLRTKREAIDRAAAAQLAETYVKRARYEEGHGAWDKAASSYARAALSSPNDPKVLERAAFATMQTGTNLKDAVAFAKRAVMAGPSVVQCRATAGRVYQAAGMMKSALGELKRALELSPNDTAIKDSIERIERGDT